MSGADHGHDAHATSSHAAPTHTSGAHEHHDDAHGDSHGHDGEALGPVDVRAWGAALLGIASGVLVLAVLYVAIRPA